jgi:hypothetical protein
VTRRATPEQMARARDVAWQAMQAPVRSENWPSIVECFQTFGELEAFRVTLLLEGKDTRSARRAIQAQKDVIAGSRKAVRETPRKDNFGGRGRPLGSKDRKPRKMRITPGGTNA